MSGKIEEILVRKKKYEVFVRDSVSPIKTFKFKYNTSNLEGQVYLPGRISEEDRYLILQEAVKEAIYKFNKRKK